MANIKNYLTEITLSIASFFWLWFVLTNANKDLGNVYLWSIGISVILLIVNITIFDKNVRVTYQKEKGKHVEAFFAGLVGWVLVLLVSVLIFKFVDPAKASIYSIIGSFGAANPAFATSKFINLVTISFAVGYGETQLFARALEFLCDKFKVPINRKNMMSFGFLIIAILLSLGFMVYHFTAKGVGSTSSLLVVAIMMLISMLMISYYNGETRQAVWTHVISNFVAGLLVLMAGGALNLG
jgi:hypothetical protein